MFGPGVWGTQQLNAHTGRNYGPGSTYRAGDHCAGRWNRGVAAAPRRLWRHERTEEGVRRSRFPPSGPTVEGELHWCEAHDQTTRIHVLTDVVGHPFALTLTPGNVSDIAVAPGLLAHAGAARYGLADKGYDADAPCGSPSARLAPSR
jgi:hypothetical protein